MTDMLVNYIHAKLLLYWEILSLANNREILSTCKSHQFELLPVDQSF